VRTDNPPRLRTMASSGISISNGYGVRPAEFGDDIGEKLPGVGPHLAAGVAAFGAVQAAVVACGDN
jgi:hypothetical protein